MDTLLLTTTGSNPWDLTKDTSGNIALATGGYALSQDAASACRLFSGELYYDTTKGVPYWTQILGLSPGLNILKALYVTAARTVPGVTAARCFILSYIGRKIAGQIQVTDNAGGTFGAGF